MIATCIIHLLQNYFDFYRANLNGEKQTLKGSLVPIYNAACMALLDIRQK